MCVARNRSIDRLNRNPSLSVHAPNPPLSTPPRHSTIAPQQPKRTLTIPMRQPAPSSSTSLKSIRSCFPIIRGALRTGCVDTHISGRLGWAGMGEMEQLGGGDNRSNGSNGSNSPPIQAMQPTPCTQPAPVNRVAHVPLSARACCRRARRPGRPGCRGPRPSRAGAGAASASEAWWGVDGVAEPCVCGFGWRGSKAVSLWIVSSRC